MTIKQQIKLQEAELKSIAAGGVHLHLLEWAKNNGFFTKARWNRFVEALLDIGIDYNSMKNTLHEKAAENLSVKVADSAVEITLYTDFKSKFDKFAICDRAKKMFAFGVSFENLEQSAGELWTALKALAIADSARKNLGLEAIRLNLFVDAQWLTTLSGKAAVVASTARKFNIELNIQWIHGSTNPADQWTTARGFQKIEWTTIQTLTAPFTANEPESVPAVVKNETGEPAVEAPTAEKITPPELSTAEIEAARVQAVQTAIAMAQAVLERNTARLAAGQRFGCEKKITTTTQFQNCIASLNKTRGILGLPPLTDSEIEKFKTPLNLVDNLQSVTA